MSLKLAAIRAAGKSFVFSEGIDLENYILGFLGIIVSVVLFLIGYRQTVGAMKERVRNANSDLEKILLRRIVLEAYTPDLEDVIRLIEGKSRDYKVKIANLLSEAQLLNTIFTRIIETDFISPNQRKEIIESLTPVITKAEKTPLEDKKISYLPNTKQKIYSKNLILLMGFITSILGSSLVIIPNLLSQDLFKDKLMISTTLIVSMATSFAIIFIIFLSYRIRESQEENSTNSLESYIEFENEVAYILKRSGLKWYIPENKDAGYEFIVEKENKKLLVEVVNWTRKPPSGFLQRKYAQIKAAISKGDGQEAIIVTKTLSSPPFRFDDSKISIMVLREFRNFLTHKF